MSRKNKKKTNQNYNTYTVVAKNDESKVASPAAATKPVSTTYFGSLSNITKKAPHVYKGRKNHTDFPEFVSLCKLTQKELIELLPAELAEAGYTDILLQDGFIYAKGDIPYLLTAHMDTVHKTPVIDYYEHIDGKGNHIISSPQGIGGDDRCGIYMILQIIKEFKPYILFCEDEEIGGIGSREFCKTELIHELENLNYLIELDRANANDAVFYDCDNPEFTDFITETTGYEENWGTFSDISTLAPACKVAAVNLSCGYYHAHTLEEEVNVEEMLNTIEAVKKLLSVEECKQFNYIKAVHNYGNWGRYGGYSGYGNYNSYYSSNRYSYGYGFDNSDVILSVQYETYDREQKQFVEANAYCVGSTKDEAWVKFFKEHPTVCWNDVLDFEYDYEEDYMF